MLGLEGNLISYLTISASWSTLLSNSIYLLDNLDAYRLIICEYIDSHASIRIQYAYPPTQLLKHTASSESTNCIWQVRSTTLNQHVFRYLWDSSHTPYMLSRPLSEYIILMDSRRVVLRIFLSYIGVMCARETYRYSRAEYISATCISQGLDTIFP
jgi:hypothetical protein